MIARIAGKEWGAYALRREMAGSGPRAIGLGCREIESAIYDSDPGNALLWHASASTDARHFSIAANPDLVNDRCGSDASEAIRLGRESVFAVPPKAD